MAVVEAVSLYYGPPPPRPNPMPPNAPNLRLAFLHFVCASKVEDCFAYAEEKVRRKHMRR